MQTISDKNFFLIAHSLGPYPADGKPRWYDKIELSTMKKAYRWTLCSVAFIEASVK